MRSIPTGGQQALSSLGRYEILSTIGSGGMAAIYLARIAGPAGFEKPIALKVIHSHLAEDPEFVTMFLDEARIAAQLQHHNIVQIFELGESGGIYYIAMEYLRGETVGTIIQRVVAGGSRLMDPRMACHIAMQAAEGLDYAHDMTDFQGRHVGLVHRDISPQNLFVTYAGSVKLMDFGIARAAGLAHSTRPGSLKGKFSYMSPEQAQGRPIDRRSDVFSLGIVLWEMLTGRRLFKGQTDIDSLKRVSEARIPRPSELRGGIPQALDVAALRALARDPEERYRTALELHEDLGLVMDQLGSPVTTHELAGRMASWFPDEEKRKKALLSRTVPVLQMPSFPAGERQPDMAVEQTPSVSETSGVRLREQEAAEASDPYTPSGVVLWAPPPTVATGPHEIEQLPPTAIASTSSSFPREQAAPVPEAEVDEPASTGPSRGLVVGGIIAGMILLGGLGGLGAFFLPRIMASRGAPPAVAVAPAVAPAPPPSTPTAPALAPPPAPGSAPGEAASRGSDPSAPAVAAPGDQPPAVPASPPPTVTLAIEVDPPDARVTVGGALQEDPGRIVLPRSSEPVEVEVEAPGRVTERFSVVPDVDANRRVVLGRARRGGGRPPRGGDLVSNPYAPR